MKRLVLAVSAMSMFTLAGWGQTFPSEPPSHARIAAHRQETPNGAERRQHQPRHRHVKRHQRRHTGV
jgi:hypothetical protein